MKNFLDKMSDYKHSTTNFKFYVSVGQELQDVNASEDISLKKLKLRLLDHEIIITEGNRVLFFPNVADKTKGLLGNLYVTNFRFVFIAYEETNSPEGEIIHQRNHLIGDYSSCLSNIEFLYQILDREKKRKLSPDSQLTEKVKGLQIVCKNMKVFTFNFDQSPITQGKSVAKTLLHHAFPGRHQLLFAYDYSNGKLQNGKLAERVVLFSEKSEWENELTRTCSMSASNWRISAQNQRFQMSTSLPKWLIIPHSVLDCDFVTASQSFRCSRPPIWTWSSSNGAALVRMADLLPTITDRTQENKMLENVRKCHPQLKGPCIKYLDKDLPSISELRDSYLKLRDLCMPENYRQFKEQDSHLYSALESSKWLHYLSCCLRVVVEAAKEIQKGITVVLQESDGRDMSATVSSLVQLVLDSHARTIIGFQSLVQKEWIALGHPFCKRLGHVRNNTAEQSPVFLFFLDCVWQLCNQFPSSFEFTETYLTSLWDAVHVSIFDTFLFDCEKDRMDAVMSQSEGLVPRSVWNWNLQFSDRDIELFVNPLYTFSQLQQLFVKDKTEKSFKTDFILMPACSLPYIEIWTQCYFRWLPVLSIKSGGNPQVDLIHRQLVNDIKSLICDLQSYSKKTDGNNSYNSIVNNNNSNNNITSNCSTSNNGVQKKNNCVNSSLCFGESENHLLVDSVSYFDTIQRKNGHNKENVKDIKVDNSLDRDIMMLIQNKKNIDNFFPFAIGNTALVTDSLANSSNLSDFDCTSVLNSTV